MKHYDIIFAEEVPHYGSVLIEAGNDDEAIAIAKAYNIADVTTEPDWNNAVCKRIVHIQDESGGIIGEDISLDDYFLRCGDTGQRLCDNADDVLQALALAESALRASSTMNGTLSESVKPLWVAEWLKALRLKINGEAKQ